MAIGEHLLFGNPKKGFQKGVSGNPRGRPKGKVVEQIKAQLKEMNFDLIASLVDLARSAESDKDRIEAIKCLMDRIYPRLKSVEVSGDVGTTFHLNVIKGDKKEPIVINPKGEVDEKSD